MSTVNGKAPRVLPAARMSAVRPLPPRATGKVLPTRCIARAAAAGVSAVTSSTRQPLGPLLQQGHFGQTRSAVHAPEVDEQRPRFLGGGDETPAIQRGQREVPVIWQRLKRLCAGGQSRAQSQGREQKAHQGACERKRHAGKKHERSLLCSKHVFANRR